MQEYDLKCQNNNLWHMSSATHVLPYERAGFSRENGRIESDIFPHVHSFWKSRVLQRLL